ncbi:helix-turn-helix domain-containing protein [Plantactinospora sp. S1510]|uniref:Helix-turn-helix domain-containing protein n=1 Tax=Plantactinospora alkalitolerans TaxID=2789879 RepID=A0ABS0H7H3_9ACTN|nr:helix-turn-helix domain-containing protein [Plantactinospora alkalitolerans]MBF9134420.1 helix-turn-helix domain-containing protein [Plantactinospora alkalitolerans]
MHAELQRIVDAVASRVGRPALIEDRRQRVVVYSEHTGLMDEVRRTSILRRHTTPEVISWFRDAGIMKARDPIRTPACAELDLLPRLCVPICHHDLLLGFVWFIDADGGMTDADIEVVTRATGELSLALYRENLLGELASQREAEAARTLLVDSVQTRNEVVRSLLADGVVANDRPATALVAQLVPTRGQVLDEVARIAMEQVLVATRRWIGVREALHLIRHDQGVLLICGGQVAGRPSTEAAARRLGEALHHATRNLTSVARVVVGVGEPRPRLADAVHSYDEALQSARVGVQLPALGPIISWANLGIYRMLSRMDERHLDLAGVHPGLDRLLREDANQVLLETLETYLDLAGNAHATAEQLRLHRTTLYYRLHRVEQLAETDLKDGNERLCLHLALKLGRLTGHYRPGH